MNNLSPKSTESSEVKIRFRCPSCSKLFSSNPNAIFVEKPHYKCTSCRSNFYVVLQEALNNSEVVGYDFIAEVKAAAVAGATTTEVKAAAVAGATTTEVKAAAVAGVTTTEAKAAAVAGVTTTEVTPNPVPFPTTSTSKVTGTDLVESPKAKINPKGVDWSIEEGNINFKGSESLVASKAPRVPKVSESLKDPLEESWRLVTQSYDKKNVHRDFLNLAKLHNRVDFSKEKYDQILRINPFDEVARSCFNLIDIEEQTEVLLGKELNKTHIERSLWGIVAVTVGVIFILLGLFVVPEYQKLVGLGLGLVIFTFALKSLFQKSQTPY